MLYRVKTCGLTLLLTIAVSLGRAYSAELTSTDRQSKYSVEGKVLVLPGGLDEIPVFNSNSPEVVTEEGILLSTCPSSAKGHPEAHLDFPLSGKFGVFFHHINDCRNKDPRTLDIALVLKNASDKQNTNVVLLSGASYLTRPDSPFLEVEPVLKNNKGHYFSGPGDRVMLDMLRGKTQKKFKHSIKLKPGESKLFFVLPIPVTNLDHPLNGRSGLLYLESDGPVNLSLVAKFDEPNKNHLLKKIAKSIWLSSVDDAGLAGSRNIEPSVPGEKGVFKYGRVAGVSVGSTWTGELEVDAGQIGTCFYPLNTVAKGTFGTGQVQSAPLAVRYPDTAYASHGNYGVKYDLNIKLVNASQNERSVALSIDTPIKSDEKRDEMEFFGTPEKRMFFRGSIMFRYKDDHGKEVTRILHCVERRGDRMPPLLELPLAPGETKFVETIFYYPPDATPPQVLSITTK